MNKLNKLINAYFLPYSPNHCKLIFSKRQYAIERINPRPHIYISGFKNVDSIIVIKLD